MIKFDDFSFSYALSDTKALRHIHLEIPENKITVLCGKSGCGKTTLLKNIKDEIAPAGEKSGQISKTIASGEISMVFQNPDTQLLCGSVLHDLAFGMENRGFSQNTMRKRMAETVCFFGIEPLLNRSPETLSGGQKQLVALCSAMMTHPKLLLLDEPLSQLDPIAQTHFLETLKRINEEFSVTIVLSEHRLHEVLPFADQIGMMNEGILAYYGEPKSVLKTIVDDDDDAFLHFVPDIAKASLRLYGKVALTPRELKSMVTKVSYQKEEPAKKKTDEITSCKDLVFSYPHAEAYVLKRLSLTINKGEFACVFGGNGSGKSTLLKIFAGVLKGYSGKIRGKADRVSYMPQNVNAYFLSDVIEDEIWFEGCDAAYYEALISDLGIKHLLKRHPYDVSSGEAGRVVLASVLLKKPQLILLDEPTKGLDPESKETVARLLKESGAAIFMATHDLEFAAQYADRCLMLFDGDVAYEDIPQHFFKENRYYTTSLNKAFRHASSDVITYEDVLRL